MSSIYDPTFELVRDIDPDEDGVIDWGEYIPVDGETAPSACAFCDSPFCEFCGPFWPDEVEIIFQIEVTQ